MTVEELRTAALELSEEDQQEFLRTILESMPLMRVNALVKHLEDTWDVSAAGAPVMMAGAASGDGDVGGGESEQTEFDVILKELGDSKLAVIKVVREVTGLGIKEAKGMVDDVPKAIKEKISKTEGEEILKKLVEAGAVAELK